MKLKVAELSETISTIILFTLVFLLPLFFTPFTTEFYDTGKLILAGVGVLILLTLWELKLVTSDRLILVKTPLDYLLVIYLILCILSTFLSPNPSLSLFGILPKIHGSLISQITVIILYFLVVANIKKLKSVTTIINLSIISIFILSIVTLSSYFKIFLPFKFAQFQNFSLAGGSITTSLILTFFIPVITLNLLRSSKNLSLSTIFYFLSLLLSVITIVLVGNTSSWVIAFLSFGATLYLYLRSSDRKLLVKSLFTPLMVIILVITSALAIFSYTPTVKDKTVLGALSSGFQRELQLPFNISWKISASAFRDSPILGTGPATYIYNFTAYKPIEFNQTPYWNVRFNSSFNQYLQSWAEVGGAGVILLLLISTTFIFSALRFRDQWGLGLSGITFILAMLLNPTTFAVQAIGFYLMALFMATAKSSNADSISLSHVNQRAVDLPPALLLRSLLSIPVLVLVAIGAFAFARFSIADAYHRQALNSLSNNKGLDAYNSLVQAERINPSIDLYRIDLAQTNFALANAIAAQKGPTEASPSGSLTDQDKTNIQQLLQQSIAEGRAATTLAPRSAANWEILAAIYRQISGVATNGLQFSLDAYGRAIQRDPYNPLLRLAVGGVYYQVKNYDLAVRFFDDAVSLKPDYSNGLYNLAVALRDKGNIAEGIKVAERLVATLQDQPDSKDYQTASSLLAELKEKAPQAISAPTTATQSAALEQQNLPKVLDLPKPSNISTPAAVKKGE